MNPAPLPVKRKWILGLLLMGAVLAAALVAGGYLYTRLAAYAEPASLGSLSSVDAGEAGRKLRQFEDSFKSNRRGFVRLDESEINSLLRQRYFPERKEVGVSEVSPAATVPQLLDARVRFKDGEITWFTWVRRDYMGCAFNLVWQRTVRIQRVGDHWNFQVVSMRVGRQTIPESYWKVVQNWLGESDQRLTDPYQWLTHLPAIEVKSSDVSQSLELVLYNYVTTPAATIQAP